MLPNSYLPHCPKCSEEVTFSPLTSLEYFCILCNFSFPLWNSVQLEEDEPESNITYEESKSFMRY